LGEKEKRTVGRGGSGELLCGKAANAYFEIGEKKPTAGVTFLREKRKGKGDFCKKSPGALEGINVKKKEGGRSSDLRREKARVLCLLEKKEKRRGGRSLPQHTKVPGGKSIEWPRGGEDS